MLKSAAVLVAAVISALAAIHAVKLLDARTRGAPTTDVAVVSQAHAEEEPAAGGPASIAKAADGHFWAEATVNGKRVRFLVDTGATTVALNAADARRLGLDPKSLSFTRPVTTAAGETRAAPVVLEYVSISGARVNRVEALVIEKGLPTSLLGMSYLGRLSRFEATKTALILRP